MILHIPHSSTEFPVRYTHLKTPEISEVINEVTDWYTNELFNYENSHQITFPYSRLWCDVERFRYDDINEKIGQGILWTNYNKVIRSPSPDEKKERTKKYESGRKVRSYRHEWEVGRAWLLFDLNAECMKCKYCIDFYGDSAGTKPPTTLKNINTFITGSTNLKKSAVSDHELSLAHVRAQKAAEKPADKNTTQAGRALLAMKDGDRNRMSLLFRNAHAVAKQNRPLTDFEWLCKLDRAKGLDTGKTYLNACACLQFVAAIADCTRKDMHTILNMAPFFSIVIAGSTDIAGDEQESLYVRVSHSINHIRGLVYAPYDIV